MKKTRGKARSEAECRTILAEWRRLGTRAHEFAATSGVPVSTLYLWKRKYESKPKESQTLKTPFREVRVARRRRHSNDSVVIEGPGGFRVLVTTDTDEAALRIALSGVMQCG